MPEPVVEVVGVYDADGGVLGEIGYAIGHALGRTECSLCSVTHGSLRRKPQWDELVSELEVPVRLVHRNETSSEETGFTLNPVARLLCWKEASLIAICGKISLLAARNVVRVTRLAFNCRCPR